MEAEKEIKKGDAVYVRAEVVGTISGYNSGPKYAVQFANGKTFFVCAEEILQEPADE